MKILLPIKPEYVCKIFDNSKKYEFRHRLAKRKIDSIIIYETCPQMKIVGEVQVVGTISMKKTPLWEHTKSRAGITRKKYREYFKGCNNAYAYVLGESIKYSSPKNLSEYGLSQAPQSFVYIEE